MRGRLGNTVYRSARGVVGTAAWAGAEPLLQRAFGTPYSDVDLFGRLIAKEDDGRAKAYGTAVHLFNGALFGAVFGYFGGRTRPQAVAAAVVENTALWPLMAWVDRSHPLRKSGTWPPLFTNPRAIAQGYAAHLLFALVLGGGRGTSGG